MSNAIGEILERIVALQKTYNASATLDMRERGRLVKHAVVEELERHRGVVAAEMGAAGRYAIFEGRDATAKKARIPWVRWASLLHSPTARQGWFVVYLFHPSGAGVSLCLMHGSTDIDGHRLVPKADAEVDRFMTFARSVVTPDFANDPTVRRGVQLGGGVGLPSYYERTTIFSKFYPAGHAPADAALLADLRLFARALAKLYDEEDSRAKSA